MTVIRMQLLRDYEFHGVGSYHVLNGYLYAGDEVYVVPTSEGTFIAEELSVFDHEGNEISADGWEFAKGDLVLTDQIISNPFHPDHSEWSNE